MDNILVIRCLGHFLQNPNKFLSNFERRKLLIILKVCSKDVREIIELKVYYNKLRYFNDISKISIYLCKSFNWYKIKKNFNLFKNYTGIWTNNHWKFYLTFKLYYNIAYNGTHADFFLNYCDDENIFDIYNEINIYTPRNLYNVINLLDLNKIKNHIGLN